MSREYSSQDNQGFQRGKQMDPYPPNAASLHSLFIRCPGLVPSLPLAAGDPAESIAGKEKREKEERGLQLLGTRLQVGHSGDRS